MKDLHTITLLQEGDAETFRAVFDEYHQRVYAYVLKKTGSPYVAEEALQVAFVKLWRFRHSLKTDISLFTQIFRITTTTMVDLIRVEGRKSSALRIAGRSAEVSTEPMQVAEANDLGKHVQKLIRRMPEMQQKVFEMSRFEDKTHREIAFSLSISVKTVETHISRAIKFLRQNL